MIRRRICLTLIPVYMFLGLTLAEVPHPKPKAEDIHTECLPCAGIRTTTKTAARAHVTA